MLDLILSFYPLIITLIIGGAFLWFLFKRPKEKSKANINKSGTIKNDNTQPLQTPNKKGEWLGKILLVVFLLILAIFIYRIFFFPSKKEDGQKGYSNQTQYGYINLTTPCEYEMNNAFTLESDDPIAQKFPGIDEPIIYAGKGESWIPPGRLKGYIKFYDPTNPKEGHKNFRIYPRY